METTQKPNYAYEKEDFIPFGIGAYKRLKRLSNHLINGRSIRGGSELKSIAHAAYQVVTIVAAGALIIKGLEQLTNQF